MKKKTPDNPGFTLIEIIVSIVVLAILGVIAGRGMLEMVNGYILSNKNATVAQLGQITVARLKKEFSSITSITCGRTNIITYDTIPRSASEPVVQSSVYWPGGSNNNLYLKSPSDCTDCTSCTGGDELANNVSNFTLSYCATPSNTPSTNPTCPANNVLCPYSLATCTSQPCPCSSTFPNSSNNLTGATASLVTFTLKLKGYGPTPTNMATISIANPDVVFLNLESGGS